MKTRLLLSALAATVLVSGAAYAAGTTPAEKCTALTTQWNEVALTHKTHAKFSVAQKEAESGIKMCKTNKDATGIQAIDKALNLLGVKPSA